MRSDPAVGDRCTMSEHGARCHLGVGRPRPRGHRSYLTVASAVIRGGSPSSAAAPSGSPPGGGHIARAAARSSSRTIVSPVSPAASGVTPTSAVQRLSGCTVGLAAFRSVAHPCRGSTVAWPSRSGVRVGGLSPSTSPGRSCTELLGVRSGIRSPFPTGTDDGRCTSPAMSTAMPQVTGCPPVIPKLSPDPARLRARRPVHSARSWGDPSSGARSGIRVRDPGGGSGWGIRVGDPGRRSGSAAQ